MVDLILGFLIYVGVIVALIGVWCVLVFALSILSPKGRHYRSIVKNSRRARHELD